MRDLFRARIAIFTIARIKNLSTAGPRTNLRFQQEIKGNLVDPASSHMLVSKKISRIWSTDGNFYHFPCKEFINCRAMRKLEISRSKKKTWLILPIVICLSQGLSNAGVARSLDLAIFIISRVKNLSTAGPSANLKF